MKKDEAFDENPTQEITAITSLRGEYAFLSNFYAAEVTYDGMTFPTNEAAFQAAKCLNMEERIPFTETKNPVIVKRMGRKVKLRSDWESVKVGIMEEIVRAKFAQHPDLAEQLVATGDLPIIEGNNWRDTFWGVNAATRRGENHLGLILMKIREEHGGKGDTSSDIDFPVVAKHNSSVNASTSEKKKTPSVSRPKEEKTHEQAAEPAIVYETGMSILHPAFGKGTISAVTVKENSRIIDVEFPGVGLKRLGAAWAEKNCTIIQ